MTALLGRTVRLFLAEGKASGLTTAEIMNWTGHVLTGSRSGSPAFMKRPELKRTGIYFLIGSDPKEPETLQVYIGESDVVYNRLLQHNSSKDKDFWERICVVTSKDQNITKAHARYLEARLIAIANASGNVSVVNGTAPTPISLPEADESDMEFFIEQIKLIFPVLGFDFLRHYKADAQAGSESLTRQTDRNDIPVFRLTNKKHGIEAQAHEISGEFVVLKGSTAIAWRSSRWANTGYARKQALLFKSGKLISKKGKLLSFAEDVMFPSPSAASAAILGMPDNGRKSWKLDGSSISYGDWQSEQVAKAASTDDVETSI